MSMENQSGERESYQPPAITSRKPLTGSLQSASDGDGGGPTSP